MLAFFRNDNRTKWVLLGFFLGFLGFSAMQLIAAMIEAATHQGLWIRLIPR